VPAEDRRLGGYFPRLASVRASALTRVLALAVLADDYPVQVAGVALAERRLGAAEDLGWSHIGVLLKGLADGEAETPEGNVIGDICDHQ
jgi:hypothetical protein